MKKIKYIFIVALILLSFWVIYSNYDYQKESADFLAWKWLIVKQNTEAWYRLNDNILRQEVIWVLAKYNNIDNSNKRCNNYFRDVNKSSPNNWICPASEYLVDKWFIEKNSYLRPEDYITKAEVIWMIIKNVYQNEYKYNKNSNLNWQEQVVGFAELKWIVDRFKDYNALASRGFFFYVFAKSIWLDIKSNIDSWYINDNNAKDILCELIWVCEEEEETNPKDNDDIFSEYENNWRYPNSWRDDGDNVNPWMWIGNNQIWATKTGLVISSNYFGGWVEAIPKTWTIDFWKFYFSANWADIRIDTVKLLRWGLGANSDIRRVYFEKDWEVISNRANVWSNGEALLSFSQKLIIKKGSTVWLTLMVELSEKSDINSEHNFIIKSSDYIKTETAVAVSWEFPIELWIKRLSWYSTDSIEISFNNFSSTINWKQNNVLLSDFSILSFWEKNYIFKSIKLRNIWTARLEDTITNLKIVRWGKTLSYDYTIDWRDITIRFYDLIWAWVSYRYQLYGDIYRWEREWDSYQFEVRRGSDIWIEEENTWFSPNIRLK